MSLQVWLPFTDGTLKQQGLSSEIVTSGGTINLTDVGKLGKCATFGSAAGGITIPASTMASFTNCSVAFWLKINDWGSSYDTYFQAGTGSTPWNNYIFGFLRNNTNSTICFTISNGSSASNANYLTSALSINTWYHIALIYETGKCKIYLNGALDHEYSTTIVPAFDKITKITLGRSNNDSSYQTQCSINDFRIYDHVLSQMEVKELSKGLVLHYPLNRGGWGSNNLLPDSSVSSLTKVAAPYNRYFENSGQSGYTCTFELLTDAPMGNIQYGVRQKVTEVAGFHSVTWYSGGQINVSIGETYTMSCYVKRISGTDLTFVFQYGKSPYVSENLTLLNDSEWHQYSWTFVPNDSAASEGTTRIYCGGLRSIGEVLICGYKLEKGPYATPWCPNSSDALATTMDLNGTIEYDCSGYCNNGTRIGTFEWTSDTPKYSVSTHIGSTSSKIHISDFSTSGFGNTYSFAWWGKRSSNSPMFWGFENGIRLNGMYQGNLWNTGDGSDNPIYKPGTTTTITAPTLNVWHHYVMTGDGTTCKLYLDGELYGQAKTYKAISGTSIWINGWNSATSYTSDNTDMSDFRIYATALSADDVKSLYQNSAYIDSNGNVYGAVHEEG